MLLFLPAEGFVHLDTSDRFARFNWLLNKGSIRRSILILFRPHFLLDLMEGNHLLFPSIYRV